MTKLEAWKAWYDSTGTGDLLANQFTLENSSHGKAFSYAWDAAVLAEREACAKLCESLWRIDGQFTADEFAAEVRARGQA